MLAQNCAYPKEFKDRGTYARNHRICLKSEIKKNTDSIIFAFSFKFELLGSKMYLLELFFLPALTGLEIFYDIK